MLVSHVLAELSDEEGHLGSAVLGWRAVRLKEDTILKCSVMMGDSEHGSCAVLLGVNEVRPH